MKMRIIVVLLGIFVSTFANAQNKLDEYFEHLSENNKVMGSFAISFNDSLIYKKAIGYRNAETKHLNDNETAFRVGSITKTFTSVLVLKAIEEGLLSLDTKLSAYYPEVKNAEKITIEQLLKHRTGIYNFSEIAGANAWGQKFHTEEEFLQFFLQEKSNFEPGTDFEYSNTNYVLLAFILQKLYHKTYAEILTEKITQPLHLTRTFYTFETDENNNEALSYNIQDKLVRNEIDNFSNDIGSGGIAATPSDINKFLFALFNGKLITKESLSLMLPEEKGTYGMGIFKLSFSNPLGYHHSGRIENYISDYYYFTDEHIAISSLANATNINTDEAMSTMLLYLYQQAPKLLNYKTTNDLSEKAFKKIGGTYFVTDKKESVTISSDGTNLIFQDSRAGQMYVPLKYTKENTFTYNDFEVVFTPKKHKMVLQQGGVTKTYFKNN